MARRVEAHYGTPQDIEWAVLDGDAPEAERVVLLQSRPETVWAADHVLALFGKPQRL